MPLALPGVIKYHVVDGREPTCRTAAPRRGDSMDVAMVVGRILFGLVFLGGAAGHFLQTDMLVKIVESKGLRPARALVLGSGVVQLAGASMVVLGLWADLGGIVLFAFLVPTAVLVHNFWRETDPQEKMLE